MVLLNNTRWYIRAKVDYLTAEETDRQALEGKEKALGAEHPETRGQRLLPCLPVLYLIRVLRCVCSLSQSFSKAFEDVRPGPS